MSALAVIAPEPDATALEIERAERELANLLSRSRRLHASRIAHDSKSCLVCFGA